MVFFESPLRTKLIASGSIGVFTATAAFIVWTKHCDIQELPATDPLFTSRFYKQFNPNANPPLRDVCTRRIPVYHLRPDLLDDVRDGGSKLVETFCGGIFGGTGMWSHYPLLWI
jgi:hypothetical protein